MFSMTDDDKRMYCAMFVYINIVFFCILAFVGICSLFSDEYVASQTCPSDCTPSDCVIYIPGSGKKTTGPCVCSFVGTSVTQYLCTEFLPESDASFWQRKPYITGLISFYKKYFIFLIIPLSLTYYWWSVGAARRDAERRALLAAKSSDTTGNSESSRTRKRINNGLEPLDDSSDDNDYDLYDQETFDVFPPLQLHATFSGSGLPGPLTLEETTTEAENLQEYNRLRAEYDRLNYTGFKFVWSLFLFVSLLIMCTIFALAYDAETDGYIPSSVCSSNCILKDCSMVVSGNKNPFEGVCSCTITNSVGTTTQYCDRLMADPNASYLQRSKNVNILVHFCMYASVFLVLPYLIAYQWWKSVNRVPNFLYYSRGDGLRDFEERVKHLLPKRRQYNIFD